MFFLTMNAWAYSISDGKKSPRNYLTLFLSKLALKFNKKRKGKPHLLPFRPLTELNFGQREFHGDLK